MPGRVWNLVIRCAHLLKDLTNLKMMLNTKFKSVFLGTREMARQLKAQNALAKEPVKFPAPKWEFRGTQCTLLTPVGTRHACGI